MSNPILPIALAGSLSLLLGTTAPAQDDVAKELEATGRSLIENPRMQGLFRSVKEDPAAVADDPAEAVRKASELFRENQGSVDLEKVDTPENREKAKTAATQVIDEAAKMLPAAAEALKEVPATRPAASTTIQAKPVAVPVEAAETPAVPDASREMVVQETTVEPIASASPTEAQLPDSPALTGSDAPDPEPLAPRYSLEPKSGKKSKKGDPQSMEITSTESIFDQKGGDLTFQGSVFLDHPEFQMKCDTLRIEMGGGGTAMPGAGGMSNFSRAIASGGMVEMKTISADGKTQIAMARRADYNKVEGQVTLSGGPPYIQDGDKFVQTTAEDAKIIMYLEEKRYEIIGDRSRIVIPVDGKDKSEGIFPGDALNLDR